MAKIMVFIDGGWLYVNTPQLAESYGKRGFPIDFGKLPIVVAEAVREQLGYTEVDVVRTYLFGSYASNNHPADDALVQKRLDFYDMLRAERHGEVEVFPINFRGRRLPKADRDQSDTFEVKEKCVDISLATSMLHFAAIPFAYDIAIAVVGDQDFKPVLQHVRRLGKRVAIAGIKGSGAEDLADPTDQARIKNFDLIWIDDLLHKLELKRDHHQIECESPTHKGQRKVWKTFYPRRNQKFYRDGCRAHFERQRQEERQEDASQPPEGAENAEPLTAEDIGQVVTGQVSTDRSGADGPFAFMRTGVGNEYYSNPTSLDGDLSWEPLAVGMPFQAEIMRLPAGNKAGAVRKVRSFTAAQQREPNYV